MPRKQKRTESAFSLVRLVIGFVFVIYGFLALTLPETYPLGPPQYSFLIALGLIGVGLVLIITRRK